MHQVSVPPFEIIPPLLSVTLFFFSRNNTGFIRKFLNSIPVTLKRSYVSLQIRKEDIAPILIDISGNNFYI